MDKGVEILSLTALCAEIVLLPIWAAAISISGINATSDYIVDNTIEQVDLKNIGVSVEILSVGVLELEITVGVFYPPPSLA